jgi:hypothetical protein
MGSGRSGLYSGTYGGLQPEKIKKTEAFQGGRTREEYSSLARDPARGTKVDYKGVKERSIALDLERQGKLGKVIRDPQPEKGADFIDTSTGQKWDIKSPISHPKGHTSVRKGAFNVDKMIANVKKEISRGNKVILDTRQLTSKDRQAFKDAIHAEGLDKSVIWYDKKGDKQ